MIDVMGYTSRNRIGLFKNRIAKKQVIWMGYCNTTGLKNMDYIISDQNLIYENEKDLYAEQVLYLPENQFTSMIEFTVGGWSLQVAMETVNIHAKYEFILPMSDVENLSNVSLKFIKENDMKDFLDPVL